MTAIDHAPADEPRPAASRWWTRLLPGASVGPPLRLVERNIVAWRGMWLIFAVGPPRAGLLPALDRRRGRRARGRRRPAAGATVPYRAFVAAGLLATSAMFGPVFDSTFNFFVKLKYFKMYDAVLATPMRPGDVVDRRDAVVAVAGRDLRRRASWLTMVVIGLVYSWWALLCVPVAVLIGFAFAGAGLGATTFMRSFIDFDWVNVAILPMFLFSGHVLPALAVPDGAAVGRAATPLYQGVVLERSLVFGELEPWLLCASPTSR